DAIGDADNELIFIVGIHIRQCKKLIVNAKDTSRTFDDDFAVGGEPRTAARHVEYFPDQNLLQAFYVQTDGRLTQAEFSRCLGVGSGLCDRDGSTQKFNRNVSSFMSTVHMLAPPESRVIDLAISLTKGLSARANRGRNIDGARDNFFYLFGRERTEIRAEVLNIGEEFGVDHGCIERCAQFGKTVSGDARRGEDAETDCGGAR